MIRVGELIKRLQSFDNDAVVMLGGEMDDDMRALYLIDIAIDAGYDNPVILTFDEIKSQ